jgi:hypothetical protein
MVKFVGGKTGWDRFKPVFRRSSQIRDSDGPETKPVHHFSGLDRLWSGPVSVFFQSWDWTFKHYSSVWEESVINFAIGWFLRPKMSCLSFFFGGIVTLWVCEYSESKLKYFIVSLPHNEKIWNVVNTLRFSKGSDCAFFQIFPMTLKVFCQIFRVHFLIWYFSQERLDESYWKFTTSFA